MNLNVYERLILLNILPAEGDITTLRIVRDLRADLSFSEVEHAALSFQREGTAIKWNSAADKAVEIPIGPRGHTLIADRLAALSKEGKLTLEHLPLYERFVEETPTDLRAVS